MRALLALAVITGLGGFLLGWLDRTNREAWAACLKTQSETTCQHTLQSAKPTN